MQVDLILKVALVPPLAPHGPFLQHLISIRRAMLYPRHRELERNLMASNGGDFAQKKVVQKNLKEEVTVRGTLV